MFKKCEPSGKEQSEEDSKEEQACRMIQEAERLEVSTREIRVKMCSDPIKKLEYILWWIPYNRIEFWLRCMLLQASGENMAAMELYRQAYKLSPSLEQAQSWSEN